MKSKEEDHVWIEQVLKGKPEAFGPLVDRYQHSIYAVVNRIIKNTAESEDITQTVFVKAFEALKGFNHKSTFSTWLHRIAYNAAISAYRKKGNSMVSLDELSIGGYNFSDKDEFNDEKETQLQQLEYAMGLLPPEDQLMIHYFYTQNYSVDQISEISKLSTSNVKVKLFRIRKKLQDLMQSVTNTCLN
jgi:RNA polymerase sigma-70 factor (ECF subfamily)